MRSIRKCHQPLSSKKLWVYDYRTNVHKTLKQNRLNLGDFKEFIEVYKADDRSKRRESKNNERWKAFKYDELIARDKINLDIFWLKDDSLEDTENLPAPNVLAQEIVEQLETASKSLGVWKRYWQEMEKKLSELNYYFYTKYIIQVTHGRDTY